MKGDAYLPGVGEAAVEVVLVGPVLEVADPQRADLLQARRLVIRRRHRAARGCLGVGGAAGTRASSGLGLVRPLSDSLSAWCCLACLVLVFFSFAPLI